jgi:predicted acyl esterase
LKITPNEVVQIDVEIWPSSTLFEKGSFLQLVIMGQEPVEYNTLKHKTSINRGFHLVYSGGHYDSYLLIPNANEDAKDGSTSTAFVQFQGRGEWELGRIKKI